MTLLNAIEWRVCWMTRCTMRRERGQHRAGWAKRLAVSSAPDGRRSLPCNTAIQVTCLGGGRVSCKLCFRSGEVLGCHRQSGRDPALR